MVGFWGWGWEGMFWFFQLAPHVDATHNGFVDEGIFAFKRTCNNSHILRNALKCIQRSIPKGNEPRLSKRMDVPSWLAHESVKTAHGCGVSTTCANQLEQVRVRTQSTSECGTMFSPIWAPALKKVKTKQLFAYFAKNKTTKKDDSAILADTRVTP